MKSIRAALLLAAALAVSPALADGPDDRGFDPAGVWYGQKGPLVLVNESTPAWLLVRYVGKKQTTAGLLERDALECREE